MPTAAPYGSWKSPITADLLVQGGNRLMEIVCDGDDLYWIEGRPSEAGRNVIVRRSSDGSISDITPEGFNARNAVHEYGGGSYAVLKGDLYFTNWDDQRIYVQRDGGEPKPLTAEPPIPRGVRYSDLSLISDGKYILCVRETHSDDGAEAVNEVVVIDSTSGEPTKIASGRDFYSTPRATDAHDGISWVEWDHPNMPWDESILMSGSFDGRDGSISTQARLAGGERESIIQPRWGPDGLLYFITDKPDWWNLHVWRGGEAINLLDAKFDAGGPDWQFGFSSYDFLDDGRVVLKQGGVASGAFHIIDPMTRSSRTIDAPYSEISYVATHKNSLFFVGGSPSESSAIVELDVEAERFEIVQLSRDEAVNPAYISAPTHIVFPTTESGEAHAWHYPPKNPDYEVPQDELPPLIVICHGGPTSFSGTGLDLGKQYWTSRGFAVVDVNYRGSIGYGKVYRDLLREKWGIYDTDDCIAAAQHLIDQGTVDKERVIIRGGSAGGYTTINALTFHNFFAAGAALYGIADLMVFIGDTHKFESRYLDYLIGPYPEESQRYHDRSAINFMDRLATPMIILQGLEDEIVPPSQAEIMVEALESKGLPYAYIGFEGEQHGFRQAANIKRAQEAELYFYGKVLGFEPADDIDEGVVDVKNLD